MAIANCITLIFEEMLKDQAKRFCYMILIALTFFSFGSYVILTNFNIKSALSSELSEENTTPEKEAAKELTAAYLTEETRLLPLFSSLRKWEFPLLKAKTLSFPIAPNTPPPDLLGS